MFVPLFSTIVISASNCTSTTLTVQLGGPVNNGEPLLELARVFNKWYRDVDIQVITTKC